MSIDIVQYRRSIGSFNSSLRNFSTRKVKPTNKTSYKNTYKEYLFQCNVFKIFSLFILLNISVLQFNGSKFAVHKRNISQNIFIFGDQDKCIEYSYSNISNFQIRYVNGNRNKKGLHICHWNKSNSSMPSKMSEIRNLISVHRPHFLGISEANYDCKKT